jgi:hypothetical protein
LIPPSLHPQLNACKKAIEVLRLAQPLQSHTLSRVWAHVTVDTCVARRTGEGEGRDGLEGN